MKSQVEQVDKIVKPSKKRNFIKDFLAQLDLQILVIPAIVHIIVFSFVPMYGILMAFQDFRIGDFPGLSEWAGMRHFLALFADPNFIYVMRNTIVISLLKLLIIFPLPIIFAVMLNEVSSKHFKKTVQTISYLPHFISWVVAATLMFDFFSVDGGAVNSALLAFGLIERPIHFFGRSEYFWWMLVGTDIWKVLGWNSIIFFAAISAVDSELYEAAEIDGAGRYSKMWNITIATIRPTIILLFVFAVGNLLNVNFEQIMTLTNQMTNATLRETGDVISTYVFRVGLGQSRFSFAAAAGLFGSVVNVTLLLIANKVASRSGNAVF